jgi:hypothetical protein
VAPQFSVQPVEHDPRLDPGAPVVGIDGDDPVEILAAIDDEGPGHGLAALRGARTTRQYRHARLAGDRNRGGRVPAVPRHDDAQRLDLIERGVGRVAPATERVEHDLTPELAPEPRLEPRRKIMVWRHR